MNEKNHIIEIASQTGLREWQIQNLVDLIDQDNTVHFIARYRKEKTGNLDENTIRKIVELREKAVKLHQAKLRALKNISESGKLTRELQEKIEKAKTLTEIEDIYAPFKRKRKTKADTAREKGFEPFARQIRNQEEIIIPKELLTEYPEAEIIAGAKDIVSQDIADNAELKAFVRQYYLTKGTISAERKDIERLDEKQKKEMYKFRIYESFSAHIKRLKSYQILALNRGEKIGILMVHLVKSEECYERFRNLIVVKNFNTKLIDECIKAGYSKIFASVEREVRTTLTRYATIDAIKTFQINLKNLLMLKPHYGVSVLAIDPAYSTGCKVCVLDKNGKPVHFTKFFLEDKENAIKTLQKVLSSNELDVVVVGNGTGSREAYELITANVDKKVVLVNESGASEYSVSEAGQEEFPELDATERGTISIGRRYIDSLSEFVKVPVGSIGIGMYQHDMNQKELERKLKEVVEDMVNLVGINVNTASVYLLSYVSGLNSRTAKKIFENRPYRSREELKKILTTKTYEQCVGFLRVPESSNVFDRTAIHPEQYAVAQFIIEMIDEHGIFEKYRTELEELYQGITNDVVADISHNYQNAGKELRQYEGSLELQGQVSIEALKVGNVVTGIVRNVTQFGAFVDIGLKNDGLIHISQLSHEFVREALDVVSIGQELQIKVIEIDRENNRVSLSLKDV